MGKFTMMTGYRRGIHEGYHLTHLAKASRVFIIFLRIRPNLQDNEDVCWDIIAIKRKQNHDIS